MEFKQHTLPRMPSNHSPSFPLKRILVALKCSPFVVARLDNDLNITWIQCESYPLLEKTSGRSLTDLFPGNDELHEIIQLQQSVLASGVSKTTDVTWLDGKETRTCRLILEPVISHTDQVEGIVTLALDVTGKTRPRVASPIRSNDQDNGSSSSKPGEEPDQLLDAVLTGNERYRDILNQIPAGVIILAAPSGQFIFGNHRTIELFESRDVLKWIFYRRNGQRYSFRHTPLGRALLNEEVVENEEVKFLLPDNRWMFLTFNAAPLYDRHGKMIAVVATFEDITVRTLAEKARRRSERRLRRLNETLQDQITEQTSVLREKADEVRKLASELTIAEQLERRRIAQILHDGLQQYLYGLLLHVQVLKADTPENNARRVQDIENILKETVQITRTLTIELSPPALHGEGLQAALQWLATQMYDLHNLVVHVEVSSTFSQVDQEVRILVFRLVRELLFNVVKHAGVNEARLIAEEKNQMLIVRVEDDGIGFDPRLHKHVPGSTGGFGLFSARERLRLFGGTLEIQSAPGKGTVVNIIVPLA